MGSFVNKTQRAGSMLRAQGFVELSNDCWDAADYISRLEAVVRALDDTLEDAQVIDERYFFGVNVHKQVWDAMKAARSRVTLPPLTQTNQAKDGDKEATNGKA